MKKQLKTLDTLKIANLDKGANIAVVASNYYPEIIQGVLWGVDFVFKAQPDFMKSNTFLLEHAGSFELPLLCQQKIPHFDGVIALGVIVRGQTAHFDYLAKAVSHGLMQVSLDYKKPVAFGLLTVDNYRQAVERSSADINNKGIEVTNAIIDSLNSISSSR